MMLLPACGYLTTEPWPVQATVSLADARAGDDLISGTLVDEDGVPITTRFNESTLRWIANQTGGRYYRSTSGKELGTALSDIAAQERRIVRWRNDAYQDLYPWGLAVAAAALSWAVVIL